MTRSKRFKRGRDKGRGDAFARLDMKAKVETVVEDDSKETIVSRSSTEIIVAGNNQESPAPRHGKESLKPGHLKDSLKVGDSKNSHAEHQLLKENAGKTEKSQDASGPEAKNSPGKGKRKRNRFKKNQKLTTEASDTFKGEKERMDPKEKKIMDPSSKKMVDIAGLIFMCNGETKKDCFKYRVFGLPEAKKDIVEQVKKGTKLFLFDIDKRVLYGVYIASSEGGMNLVQEAFKDSDRKFPAQVRFRIHKDCMPLEESVFKGAIRENYFRGSKFRCELNDEQVGKLLRLFRPLDSRGFPKPKPGKDRNKKSSIKSNAFRGSPRDLRSLKPISRGDDAPLHRRDNYITMHPREYAGSSTYAREEVVHMPSAYPPPLSEAEALYQERILRRQLQEAQLDAFERRASYALDPIAYDASFSVRRYVEDNAYAEQAQQALVLRNRPLLPSDHLYREIVYQRELSYRGYGDSLPYDPESALRYRM